MDYVSILSINDISTIQSQRFGIGNFKGTSEIDNISVQGSVPISSSSNTPGFEWFIPISMFLVLNLIIRRFRKK